ncbi:LysR family transcriptional regulator [Streptomyces zagrosensis]|uniref:DNA-binding transcriptional LysR family regulator n=1 Tax=Streptomyces zagrosensis TaxID=1042984 RepID=A0A7W9Q5T1_9ACTN|nr:LysR family transcriptional regulator [Streptomyces zagrosensis]MBB5934160.1 DNA-binding transcriptional LysR family regulator [Streptomyces zagrosensis]
MDLALLRTFIAVYRAGSLTRAATLLGLSQPAVTGQIRSLERQLGRPLFIRRARGVTPTSAADELAHKTAPHIDALLEITESDSADITARRTLHLGGPPEFTTLRVLPALAPLVLDGLAVRTTFGTAEELFTGLSVSHYDLAITTSRPRGRLLTATPLCDEEHVLIAAPRWAARLGTSLLRASGGPAVLHRALEPVPVIEVHESLPLVTSYWAAVFDAPIAASGTIIAPDLRAVLACVMAGSGLAVLPRYLCMEALDKGEVVALLEPPVPPLRTYFLVVRTGTLASHLARAHDWLLRAAVDW